MSLYSETEENSAWYVNWDIERNVPILSLRKGKWKLKNDFWLMSYGEKLFLSSFVKEHFGINLDIEDKFFIIHKLPSWSPHIDFVGEVFGEGVRVGLLSFDKNINGWLLDGSGAFASILLSIGAKTISIETTRKWLSGKKIDLKCEKQFCLILCDEYIGFAKRTSNGLYKVIDMAKIGFKMLGKPSIDDLVSLNKHLIDTYVSEAIQFIKHLTSKFSQEEVPVAFSGGSDSTALLSLAVEALGKERVIAIYTNTKLEFPETMDYAEKIADLLGVQLVVLDSIHDPIHEIKNRGLMSIDNRWCTRLLKIEALKKYYKENNIKFYLDGARSFESELRRKTPRLAENPLIKNVKRALPIKYWPRMLVQLYLLSRKIPFNPLYDKGLSRIGCLVCPAMYKYELLISYHLYKDLHEAVINASNISRDDYLSLNWKSRKNRK